MNTTDWLYIGLLAGGATYLFRALPFVLGDDSLLRRPRSVRFATLTSLAVTAGLVSTTLLGGGAIFQTGLKAGAVILALMVAPYFRSALVPLFVAIGTASLIVHLSGGA